MGVSSLYLNKTTNEASYEQLATEDEDEEDSNEFISTVNFFNFNFYKKKAFC